MSAANGQYELKESFYHLELVCKVIAEKLAKPDINTWTNRDYLMLSGTLARSTSIQISPNTLKRIFGKLKTTERYYPQKATRDALVQFLGFESWDNFVTEHPRPVIPVVNSESSLELTDIFHQSSAIVEQDKQKSGRPFRIWGSIIICLVIITTLILIPLRSDLISTEGIELVCRNPEGKNPHSAVFSLKIPDGFAGDKEQFTVNFGDGKPQRALKRGVFLTHYYEVPGRYYATLNYQRQPIDTIPIYLRTEGWTATARVERDTFRVYPVNIEPFEGKMLSVSTEALQHAGVDTNKTFFVDFVNTAPFGVDGDNFILTCSVNTSAERAGVRCSQLELMAYGEKTVHKLFLLKPGCEAWTNLQFSEFMRDGEEDDLNFLGADFTTGGVLSLAVQNKQVAVSVNNRKVYSATYKQPVGTIYGIKISFSGIGGIHGVQLKDANTGSSFDIATLK